MTYFDLSSSQKMLLFSEINNPHNDSFYLKFRKDYHLNDFDIVKQSIKFISEKYLNLKIKYDENGEYKQYYDNFKVNVESFEISNDNLDKFIVEYLDNPFDNIFDSPLYKWAVLKTETDTILIGVVQMYFSTISFSSSRVLSSNLNPNRFTSSSHSSLSFSYSSFCPYSHCL